MNKLKNKFIKRWGITYAIIIFLTYLTGYLYWQWKLSLWQQYYLCWKYTPLNDKDKCGGVIEPDGPLGALLVVVIPFVVTILFILLAFTTYHFQKRRFNKTGKK